MAEWFEQFSWREFFLLMTVRPTFLILLATLFIFGCQAKALDPASIKVGDTYVLKSQYYEYVTVWPSLGMAEAKEMPHTPSDIKEMVDKDALYDPPNGIKIKVLDWTGERERANLRKVKILDGDFKGKEGWIPYTTLQPSP